MAYKAGSCGRGAIHYGHDPLAVLRGLLIDDDQPRIRDMDNYDEDIPEDEENISEYDDALSA